MKRIDPTVVPEVFERLGLRPVAGAFVRDVAERECCVLSALYCDASGCQSADQCLTQIKGTPFYTTRLLAEPLGIDDGDYAMGVIEGWDEPDKAGDEEHILSHSDDWYAGFQDGLAARREVERRGVPVASVDRNDKLEEEDYEEDYDDEEDYEDCDWDDEDELDDEEDGE